MELHKNLSILGLSNKEEKVLLSIIKGISTPLSLAKETKVTRPAVYDILKKLKSRGLVNSQILNGKKSWKLSREEDISQLLYNAKKIILSIPDGSEEVKGPGDGIIVIHRGKEAIIKELDKIFTTHKNQRWFGFQGTKSAKDWENLVGIDYIIKINNLIKKNNLIVEAVLPDQWYKEALAVYGKEWAESYLNRAAAMYEIPKNFFEHKGELFMFKDALYLVAVAEETIIEIKHSAIQDMILAMIRAIEAGSRKIDINAEMRSLIGGEVK